MFFFRQKSRRCLPGGGERHTKKNPRISRTIWREKKSQNKYSVDHTSAPLTSINSEIDRRNDGDVLIAQQISDI